VGSKGAITSASGTLATPELLGDYPLIDTKAAIDRLNEQQQAFDDVMPLGAPGRASSSGEETTLEVPASPPPTIVECTTGPDGAESCSGTGGDGCFAYPPDADADLDGPTTTYPCRPYAEPEPVEVVLHEAERVLVQLPSFDGTGDSYLLSGYRFTGDDGHIAEVAAVDDESLAPTPPPDTTVPTAECETLVEQDASGTTHTVNPCPPATEPADPELRPLAEGEQPQVGVAYYVDVQVMTGHCSWISAEVADRWWWAELSNEELAHWSTPTEGGSFTLVDEATAEFVGDADRTKVAKLVQFDDGTHPPLCA
jgi:hypothetical protein